MHETAGITLVLGGARSGKSEVAERYAAAAGPSVTYVATGTFAEDDGEDADPTWQARIAAHQIRRPATWGTAEVAQGAGLAAPLVEIGGVALVDSIGTWLAGLEGFGLEGSGALAEGPKALLGALGERRRSGRPTVLVSEEVGMGVHPSTAAGGAFRDALGVLNRQIADVADQVLLVVAGRVLALEPPTPVVRVAMGDAG